MNQRVLPEPDKHAVCPLNGAILPFYDGTFEAACLILSPFARRKASTVELIDDSWEALSAGEYCQLFDLVPWSEVREICGLPSIASIDVALKTMIGALKSDRADKQLADVLASSLKQHGLFPPCEGVFPELIQEPLLSFLQTLGQTWVWVGDELGTQRKLHGIDDLKPANAKVAITRGSVFTPDKAHLWTVHWDSHFTLYCSSQLNVERLAAHPELEGFVCTRETQIDWSLSHL